MGKEMTLHQLRKLEILMTGQEPRGRLVTSLVAVTGGSGVNGLTYMFNLPSLKENGSYFLRRWPGIEPESTEWKAAMFTTIPSMQPHFVVGSFLYLIQIQITAWDFSFFPADENIFFDRKLSSRKKKSQ